MQHDTAVIIELVRCIAVCHIGDIIRRRRGADVSDSAVGHLQTWVSGVTGSICFS